MTLSNMNVIEADPRHFPGARARRLRGALATEALGGTAALRLSGVCACMLARFMAIECRSLAMSGVTVVPTAS